MSGGVDSSVAAKLLLAAGYDVVGLFLRNGIAAPTSPTTTSCKRPKQGCCSVEDAADARRVAASLDIPFYALDYSDQFERLIDHFVDSYNRGETPSPCVLCNTWLKFGELVAFAKRIGAVAVATGHYARVVNCEKTGRLAIARAHDSDKDQSYFLAGLNQEQLAWCRFPLGELTKPQVRDMASEASWSVADKPESMEVCFVPDGDYRTLIEKRRPGSLQAGEIVDSEGNVLGRHDGFQGFTVGQRKGLGVSATEPLYVQRLDTQSNRVVVGTRTLLARRGLVARDVVWNSVEEPKTGESFACKAQIRHRHRAQPAVATVLADTRIGVLFDEPVEAVAPGQAVVLFRGDTVLAGGWIAADTAS